MSKSEYYMPYAESYIRVEQFHLYEKDDLIEMIHYWFNENHINPAENCPVDSGEYIYIYGGPIRPEEALNEEFEGIIGEGILYDALEQLPDNDDDYSLLPDINWSDYTATDPYSIFNEHIDDIRKLSAVHNNDLQIQQKYLGMLFSNTVTTFEIFISDTLVQSLHENTELRNKFLNSVNIKPIIKERLISEYEKYWSEIVEIIYSITFSNSKKLINNFCDIQNIQISKINIQELEKVSVTRNDIMHRNGKNKKGEERPTDESALEWCIGTILDIVREVTLNEGEEFVKLDADF